MVFIDDEEREAPAVKTPPHFLLSTPPPPVTTSLLRPHQRFVGQQLSGKAAYQVLVELQQVDLANSFISGYLSIQGLTQTCPELVTCFEGEVIGPKHLFFTRRCEEWGALDQVDVDHWLMFQEFRTYALDHGQNPDPAVYLVQHLRVLDGMCRLEEMLAGDMVFMRWKEKFLVPDAKVEGVNGASYDGFYYVCFSQRTGGWSGCYFHRSLHERQSLDLRVERGLGGDRGCGVYAVM